MEERQDLISRQAAYDALMAEPLKWDDSSVWESARCHQWMMDMDAIKALPFAQPEQTDCEHCHEDSDGYVKPIEKNCHAFIRFGMEGWELSLKANGWHGSAKIKYCPMCGRELKK